MTAETRRIGHNRFTRPRLEPGPAGAGRLPAGGHRPQAGKRAPVRRSAGAAFRRFPLERDGDRRASRSGGRRGSWPRRAGRDRGNPAGRRHQHQPGDRLAARPAGGRCRNRSISPMGSRMSWRRPRSTTPGRSIARFAWPSPAGWARYPTRISHANRRSHSGPSWRMAAERDSIARQYANGFREVLGEALPALRESLDAGSPLETAIVSCYLRLLARHPDSLIVRKYGICRANEVSHRAAELIDAGWPECDERGFGSRRLIPGSGSRPTDSTPARRPTWSRPPCTPHCEMGQSRLPWPRPSRQ